MLKPITRSHTLTLFVIVAAQQLDGIVMTGDPEFHDVTELAKIEWLKRRE